MSSTKVEPAEQQTRREIENTQAAVEASARQRHDNRAMNALFVPVLEEQRTPRPCRFTGEKQQLPSDLPRGALLRIGPNGAVGEGFLDGDGMIHCITLPPETDGKSQQPHHSATYVDSCGRVNEQQRGDGSVYNGTLGAAPNGWPLLVSLAQNAIKFKTPIAQKDTCNTALANHKGRILALMEQAPPSEIEVAKSGSVITLCNFSRLDGAVPNDSPITGGCLAAHGRTCPETGERIHCSYGSINRPFIRVDTFEGKTDSAESREDGFRLKHSVGVDIPVPVMMHDIAITRNYVVLFDLPLTVRSSRIFRNSFPVEYEPSNPSRIGLLSRDGTGKVLWFDCAPGVVLHAVNAHESDDGSKVVIHAFRSEPKGTASYILNYTTAFLHEYEIDLLSGTLKERCMNPHTLVEFPVIDERFVGAKVDHVFGSSVSTIGGPSYVHKTPEEGILIDGVVKLALTGPQAGAAVDKYTLPETFYAVSEPTVVPKTSGDGVYVLLIATQVPENDMPFQDAAVSSKSRLLVLDGADLKAGPVTCIELPQRVPYGLHSLFVEWKDMI